MRLVKQVALGLLLFTTGVCMEQAGEGSVELKTVLKRAHHKKTFNTSLVLQSFQPVAAPRPSRSQEVLATAARAPRRLAVRPESTPTVNSMEGADTEIITLTSERTFPPKAPAPPSHTAETTLVAPEDAFRLALRYKRAALEHCYEQELKKQAAFDGFLVVSVSLSADGKVTDAHIEEGSRRDAQVGACILAQLRQLQLPPLTEEAELIVPIRLEAKEPT